MEHVCTGLQGGRAAQYDEAQPAIPKAGIAVDTKHLAVGCEKFIHGEAYLDKSSLCRLHDGMLITPSIIHFHTRWTNCSTPSHCSWDLSSLIPRPQEHNSHS